MRAVVIVNPACSRGTASKKVAKMAALLDEAVAASDGSFCYRIKRTSSPGAVARTGQVTPGSAAAIAKKAGLDGADIVVAAGGDGTVGEVANGLLGTDTPLGVIPLGTGNDFARSLGIGTDLELAVKTLFTGESRPIDLGKIHGGGHFINVAGCGFDADVAHRVNHGFRHFRGTGAYLAGVLQALAKFRACPITLILDGVVHQETAMLCAVANARSYGGGMKIAPYAELSDGLFDVVLIGDVSRGEFLRAFPRVFKGTHLSHPKVKHFRCSRVSINASRPLPALADGEEIGETPMEFEIVPSAVRVQAPRTG